MALKLVFLGRLEDVAGGAERTVAALGSIDAVLDSLEPELAAALRGERIKVAINGALVTGHKASLQDGDELAFLPPVSGG